MKKMTLPLIDAQVAESIREDVGDGDISAALIPSSQQARAQIKSREPALVCGLPWVESVYKQIDPAVQLDWRVKEGQSVAADQIWLELRGPSCSLLSGERCALNWLQTLSGTATRVHQFLQVLKGCHTQLLDTRKTIPGLRAAQKYAVRCAGGRNHRMGLYDAYLLKENHIASCGSITQAVQWARERHPGKIVEVEVENLAQLDEALVLQVEIIMLDNFQLSEITQAVSRNRGHSKLEVSGNITLENIREIAATGIDFISVGSLTKHIQAIDLSMRFL
jgi:nicotinate-nucleotide pyrophosphorylase (carboxylating)